MQNQTVLVVTARAQTRSAISRELRREGLHVQSAGNALAAMLICACSPVDAVVTDAGLPGINGHQLALALARALPAIPVVVHQAGDALGAIERIRTALQQPLARRPTTAAPNVAGATKTA